MRRAYLAALALLGCHAGDGAAPSAPAPVEHRPPIASREAATAAHLAPKAEDPPAARAEGPLTWATRPAGDGPFYPVVDGMCVHAEVRETGGAAIFTYGNEIGSWSRGGATTVARFSDEGLVVDPALSNAAEPGLASSWARIASIKVMGTWPTPLFLYSHDNGFGRSRDHETIWRHDVDGWRPLASWRDAQVPSHGEPILFQGHLVTVRQLARKVEDGEAVDFFEPAIATFPVVKDAPAIAGISSLVRTGFTPYRFFTSATTIYGLGGDVIRWVRDGKANEVKLPELYRSPRMFGATADALYLLVDDRLVVRLQGGKLAPVNLKLPPSVALQSVTLNANEELWALTTRGSVVVARGGSVTETPLPKPSARKAEEHVLHWPTTGRALAGVEVDDPWAIAHTGTLYHLEGGAWREVPLPTPPFASSGRYQAQALYVPAKGDVYVNAGYAEKGVGWRTEERYRGILRTKKPREVMRCNEPRAEKSDTGVGFASFPPIATEACTTPVAILLRIGHSETTKEPVLLFDRKTDYPSIREAIKATPSLGASVELVEVVSGDTRYLAAKVASYAAGKALALAVTQKVQVGTELRPEVVCGEPKAERVLRVDVATGKVQ